MSALRRALAPLAAALSTGLAACGGATEPGPSFVPEYITVRRAWAPGERDSVIARVLRTRQLVFPYVGDLSDYIDGFLDRDSAVDIVPNPAIHPSVASPFGPSYSLSHVSIPGTGWTTAGVDVRIVNNAESPASTLDWLGVFWYNNGNEFQKGFIFVATSNTVASNVVVNTTTFDNAGGKAGAGGGEVQGTTVWLANGGGSGQNRVSIAGMSFGGSAQTVTTGPFLGGTQRYGVTGAITISGVQLTRVQGTQNPSTQTINFSSGSVTALELTCVFPSPCTTNRLMADAGRP